MYTHSKHKFCWWNSRLLPFISAYHASKFAIEGFTESLRQELADFNINIILIEPGFISSNFMDNMKTAKGFDPNKSSIRQNVLQQVFQGFESISAYVSPFQSGPYNPRCSKFTQPRVKKSCRKRCRIDLQSTERTI